jgi:NIPSNAP
MTALSLVLRCRSSLATSSRHLTPPRQTLSTRLLSTMSSPVVELREYTLAPAHATSFLKKTAETIDLRTSCLPLRLFCMPETGGPLQVATHFYYYEGGLAERDAQRAILMAEPDWQAYIATCRPFSNAQASSIYVQAPLVKEFGGRLTGLSEITKSLPGSKPIYEIRRYHLKLGYDTVPQFLEHYKRGLPSKLDAQGTDPTTSLVTLLYSEVGRLNEVIEVWRHGEGATAMEASRVAARGASEWRKAIADIAPLAITFTNTIYKPTGFSPMR